MNARIREWIVRYLPAEGVSLAVTMITVLMTWRSSGSLVSVALAGTWAGNIGYYGYLLAADGYRISKVLGTSGRKYSTVVFLKNVRALVAEFGIAELLDSVFVRPALMYFLPLWSHQLILGSVLGKLLSDIIFYIPAIIAYERTKDRYRKF